MATVPETNKRNEKIVKDFLAGVKMVDLMAKYHLSYWTIRTVLASQHLLQSEVKEPTLYYVKDEAVSFMAEVLAAGRYKLHLLPRFNKKGEVEYVTAD